MLTTAYTAIASAPLLPPKCATNTLVLADAPRFGPSFCQYSPECVEGEFCELPLYGVLRSSARHAAQLTILTRMDDQSVSCALRVVGVWWACYIRVEGLRCFPAGP